MKLPDKVYDILKWVALLALPAISVFYATIGPVWNLPNVNEVVTTINACSVLVGALIGISTISHNKE